jgi:hypothetical protein
MAMCLMGIVRLALKALTLLVLEQAHLEDIDHRHHADEEEE